MKMIIIILICFFLSVGTVYASDEARVLFEKCKNERGRGQIVKCIGGYDFSLFHAYMNLHFPYGEPLPDEAWNNIRFHALYNIYRYSNKNEIQLQALKYADLNIPYFISIYEKAIIWAEKEAELNADELYLRSKTFADEISDELSVKRFQQLYLDLAAKKGA